MENQKPEALAPNHQQNGTSKKQIEYTKNLYEDARMTVIEAGKASTSYLQRKLGIGYARAAKLIDMLEERHVIGAGNGAKPREVLEKPMDNTMGV